MIGRESVRVGRWVLALSVVALAPSLQAQQTTPRVRVMVPRDSTRPDSMSARYRVNLDAISAMINDLMNSRQLEAQLAAGLRGQTDPVRLKALEGRLADVARRQAALVTTLQLQCARSEDLPTGYLGVTFELLSRVVSSLELGSPAEKAGIRQGDELLTIGGYPADRAPLPSLLKPGAKVVVRYQRDGAAKDVTVIAAKRPEEFGATVCTGIDELVAPERTAPMVERWRVPSVVVVPRTPNVHVVPREAPLAPTAPVMEHSSFVFVGPSSMSGMGAVAGATLTPVDDDWRESLGVQKGLVVLGVSPGSPAADAGLHNGDVITQAGDAPVTTVMAFRRLLNNADARSVKLQVVRKGKPQQLTLKWQ